MFFANLRETFILWCIKRLTQSMRSEIVEQKEELERLQKTFEQTKKDFIYLIQQGFSYENDMFIKKEKIDYGRFPGTYKIVIRLPDNYPFSQPIISFIPQGDFKVSRHIMEQSQGGAETDYQVCVMKGKDSSELGDYWNPTMNVKGALMLSYQVVTGKLEDAHGKHDEEEDTMVEKESKRQQNKRRKIPIRNTIFEELEKVSTIEKFVKEFKNRNSHLGKIDTTYKWEELAYVCSQMSKTQKHELITFYNKEKTQNEKLTSKRKKQN